jgi:hypothetical protein
LGAFFKGTPYVQLPPTPFETMVFSANMMRSWMKATSPSRAASKMVYFGPLLAMRFCTAFVFKQQQTHAHVGSVRGGRTSASSTTALAFAADTCKVQSSKISKLTLLPAGMHHPNSLAVDAENALHDGHCPQALACVFVRRLACSNDSKPCRKKCDLATSSSPARSYFNLHACRARSHAC